MLTVNTVIALLFGVACADQSWMQEHAFSIIHDINTFETFDEWASPFDRSYSDIEVAAQDSTLKFRKNGHMIIDLNSPKTVLSLYETMNYMRNSDATGHHCNPCHTCSKSSDGSNSNYIIKTDRNLGNWCCNNSKYMEYPIFDYKPGTVSLNSEDGDGPETYGGFVFDYTSNLIYSFLASLTIFLFCGAFVNKPITSSIVMQMLAFIIIPSVSAIDIDFKVADYSLTYDNAGAAYGTTSDGTMYMIGGYSTAGRKNIVKWNPSVDPNAFIHITLDTDVLCWTQCGAMIKAYDGHEYLFMIGSGYNNNVLIFNTTSDSFVDNTIAPTVSKHGCVTTDGVSKIYYSAGSSTTQMAELDVSKSIVGATWKTLQSATNGRTYQYCFYLNGVHYDFAGQLQKDSWKYSVRTNDWKKMDYTFDYYLSRGQTLYWSKEGFAFLLAGTVYRPRSGRRKASYTNTKVSYIFDPVTETMTELYKLQVARRHPTLSIVDNTLFVLGGYPSITSIEVANFTTKRPTKAPTDEPTAAPTVECVWECIPLSVCEETDNYNIVFVLDESGSVTATNYEISLDFVQTLIAEDVNSKSSVSVITFSDDQETLYSLANNQNDGRVSVNAEIENEKDDANYDGRTTDTLNAVIAGMDEIKHNEDYTNNILILITDGQPDCGGHDGRVDTDCKTNICDVDLMREIKEYGVTVVIIGITDMFDGAEVSCLSSDIIEIDAYTSDYFESIQDDIRDVTCTSNGGESAAYMTGDNVDALGYIESVGGSVGWTNFDLFCVFIMGWFCCCLCFYSFSLSKTKKLDSVVYDSA